MPPQLVARVLSFHRLLGVDSGSYCGAKSSRRDLNLSFIYMSVYLSGYSEILLKFLFLKLMSGWQDGSAG